MAVALSTFLTTCLEFAALYAAVYGCNVAAYFAVCGAIDYLNRRNPERRIQKTRRGDKRIREEIRHSLKSIAVTAASLSIGVFALLKGWTPFTPFELTWWTAVPLFLVTMVLFDAWFYFGHRLLHTKPFYKYHLLHHRSVAPTVWSSDSIGLVDTAICQGFYAVVPFILPIPPVILVAHRVFDHVNGTFGHAGFEYFESRTARHPWPLLCATYHDLHHSEFRYNFANYFSVWDRLLGTAHPGYDRMVAALEAEQAPMRFVGPPVPEPQRPARAPAAADAPAAPAE
ncbi:sterol desaturase family protein [Chthonobacter rhizosphaerae]|uniref:sterol desaturase family protein n=1 Tax=Chthonobacter rhizosphaerae TaxID=2735553 RepID=UPI0015EF2566|nr:sterol desaturase family protein [Chthonobacter rhizosphaerae]